MKSNLSPMRQRGPTKPHSPTTKSRHEKKADLQGKMDLHHPFFIPRKASARWVYLREWLMEALEDLCPLEDRTPERRIFQGVTEASAYQTMLRACQTAGVPHYHPHDLRHRRITVWHQSGVVARELAERAGHARASITLDVYSHVMPLDEAPIETLTALARARA
jgi:integrase